MVMGQDNMVVEVLVQEVEVASLMEQQLPQIVEEEVRVQGVGEAKL